MKLRDWITSFLVIYGVALVVFMFSTSERTVWYEIASFVYFVVVNAQSWYYWSKDQKIENVDDNEIEAMLRNGKKKAATLKVRKDSKCGLLSAIIYVREVEKTMAKD